jgi:hypothetical protein
MSDLRFGAWAPKSAKLYSRVHLDQILSYETVNDRKPNLSHQRRAYVQLRECVRWMSLQVCHNSLRNIDLPARLLKWINAKAP